MQGDTRERERGRYIACSKKRGRQETLLWKNSYLSKVPGEREGLDCRQTREHKYTHTPGQHFMTMIISSSSCCDVLFSFCLLLFENTKERKKKERARKRDDGERTRHTQRRKKRERRCCSFFNFFLLSLSFSSFSSFHSREKRRMWCGVGWVVVGVQSLVRQITDPSSDCVPCNN